MAIGHIIRNGFTSGTQGYHLIPSFGFLGSIVSKQRISNITKTNSISITTKINDVSMTTKTNKISTTTKLRD